MQQNKLYREEALKRISSPDQLNGYIRTSTSAIWFVLGAILLVLISIVVWGFTGSFEILLETQGGTYNEQSICFIHASERDEVQEGMYVRYLAPDKSSYDGIIASISTFPIDYNAACEQFSVGLVNRMGLAPGTEYYLVDLLLKEERKNEFATVRIVRDTVSPSQLLFNTNNGDS